MSHEQPRNSLSSDPKTRRRIGDPSRTTLWRWVNAGLFPKPVRIGGRNYWSDAEVDEWIAARLAERNHDNEAA